MLGDRKPPRHAAPNLNAKRDGVVFCRVPSEVRDHLAEQYGSVSAGVQAALRYYYALVVPAQGQSCQHDAPVLLKRAQAVVPEPLLVLVLQQIQALIVAYSDNGAIDPGMEQIAIVAPAAELSDRVLRKRGAA